MSDECDKCGDYALECICKDLGHHCKKGTFVCFRLRGDAELTLDAPKNMPIIVFACPICGKTS